MATTTMTSANNSAVKLWEMKTWYQIMASSALGHIYNRGGIYFPASVGKGRAGDNITFDYVGKLTKKPVGEGENLSNNMEALDTTTHSMAWNVIRIGVESPNKDTIEQQRTNIDFQESAIAMLKDRAREILEISLFQHLGGCTSTSLTVDGTSYTSSSDLLKFRGNNATTGPTSERIVRPTGVSNDQGLTSSYPMKLEYVDYALEKNYLSSQPIMPFDDGTFDLFLSPEQATSLQHSSGALVNWLNIELARIQSGSKSAIDNIYRNNIVCLGRYKNVYLYMSKYVPYGVNSSTSAQITTVRRAVLIGKDAVSFASPFGGKVTDKSVPTKIIMTTKDVDYYQQIECRMMYGLKKMAPANKQDIGVMVIGSYAAASSS